MSELSQRLRELMAKATSGPVEIVDHYGDERLVDDISDSTYSTIKPVCGSWPEEIICEVWGTEHDDSANAAFIEALWNNAPAIIAALEADKDAERYRFIRANFHMGYAKGTDDYWQISGEVKTNFDGLGSLDDAVDSARAKL